jgi:glycosyltransferase involved in cell wall biosynthesis
MLNYSHESVVVHPPVDYRKHDTGKDSFKNEFITLVNLDQNKGGEVLREIAKRMPHKKFLGIKGSYSEPAAIGQIVDQPENVKIEENTPFIRQVYERTKIILMPSKYESWGMVATEAMSSGIPVICNPTFGLKENCGKAGIYVDRDDINGWVKAIEKLDDEKEYRKASKKAKDRSRELDPEKELREFELWAREIKNRYNYI